MLQKEIEFIARHYRKGLFTIEPALYRIKGFRKKFWTFPKIAAVSSIVITIGATAAILITNSYNSSEIETEAPIIENISPALVSHVIDFDDVPLTTVVEQINLVYGVEVENIPINADEIYISLHYEGTASDLIETINEIVGTQMRIKQ